MKDSFVKRFLLTCNPWFLASTLFLLLGIYLVYVDPKLAGQDETQMYISFSSLQLYEVLCLGVVFLFRKIKLFYDSVFLVVIICMLLFVPFITFNQALQYDDSTLELLGYTALVLAALKLIVLKLGFKNLNFPWMFLVSGLLMLVMNFSLPFVMKGLNLEDDIAGREFINDVFSIAIPIIGFIGYAAMYNIQSGKKIYQSKWLPITLFQCFFSVTLVNLMSVMYVYDIEYNSMFYAMTLLVSGFLSIHPVIGLSHIVKRLILTSSLFIAVVMLGPEFKTHFAIVLTLILLFSIGLSDKWTGLISFSFLLLLGLNKFPIIHMNFAQMCLGTSLIAVIMIAREKQCWATLILPGIVLAILLKTYDVNEASLLVFAPMSLCLFIATMWDDEVFKSEESFIISLAVLWSIIGLITHVNSGWGSSFGIGLAMLAVQLLKRYVFKSYQPMIMILVSALIVLLWPIEEIVRLLKEQSFSIIVIISSFIIFIAGTCVTYRKRIRQL